MSGRLLRRKVVLERTGFGKSTLYKMMNAGLFPKPVALTPSGYLVAWPEKEVDDWISQKVAGARTLTPAE